MKKEIKNLIETISNEENLKNQLECLKRVDEFQIDGISMTDFHLAFQECAEQDFKTTIEYLKINLEDSSEEEVNEIKQEVLKEIFSLYLFKTKFEKYSRR